MAERQILLTRIMFGKLKSNHIDKLWKPFVALFLLSYLMVNWHSISWLFNYETVLGMTGIIFQKEEATAAQNIPQEEKSAEEVLQKSGSLEIPKLDVTAPMVFVEEAGEAQDGLLRGVVHWPESALPGQEGQTFILGHSAPLNWPKIRYAWVFSRTSELRAGDEVLVTFNSKKYSYRVTRQILLEKGEEIPANPETGKSFIYLITCWPPGKDIRRLAVEAQLI